MKVYLSGEMSNVLTDFTDNSDFGRWAVRDRFDKAERFVNTYSSDLFGCLPCDLVIFNPADENDWTKPKSEYLKRDLAILANSDAIVMLPGWQDSEGASLEEANARALGLKMVYLTRKDLGFDGWAQEHRKGVDSAVPKPDAERPIRVWPGGACRDTDAGKLDFEAALSPLVLEGYVDYLGQHRKMPNGSMRDWDNWQAGFGDDHEDVCMKSLARHYVDAWKQHRGLVPKFNDALYAIIFNASAILHSRLVALAEGRA